MGSQHQGLVSLQQETQLVATQFDDVVSKAFSTSRTLFHDFFSQTQGWLQSRLQSMNQSHYSRVNQASIQSLGETSLSQNVLLYHASKRKTNPLTLYLVMKKMKTLLTTRKKIGGESPFSTTQALKKEKKSK